MLSSIVRARRALWICNKARAVGALNAPADQRDLGCAAVLTNIYDALEDGGFLMFFEMTTVLPTLLWGLDAQCWNFEDEREFGLWVNQERWVKLLEEVGFTQVGSCSGLVTLEAVQG